jgi:hypothetical protein
MNMINWTEGFLPYELAFQAIFILTAFFSRKITKLKPVVQHVFFAEVMVRFFTVWMAYVGRTYTESSFFWIVLFGVGLVNWAVVIWVCFEKKERMPNIIRSITTFFLLPLSMNLAVYNREVTHGAFTPHVFGDSNSVRNVTVFCGNLAAAVLWWLLFLKPRALKAKLTADAKQPSQLEARVKAQEEEIRKLEEARENEQKRCITLRNLLLRVQEGAKRHLAADDAKLDEVRAELDRLFVEATDEANGTIALQDAQRETVGDKM